MGVTVHYSAGQARTSARTGAPLHRFASVCAWCVTAALFAILGALLVVRLLGMSPLIEQTGSMAPSLKPGDVLLVRSVPARTVRIGDIVTFANPNVRGRTITHRVTRIFRNQGRLSFTTRGDSNRTSEQWAIAADGRVVRLAGHVPAAGRLARPIQDPKVRGLLSLLLAVTTSAGVLRKLWAKTT